jgi:hypothetical protein
LAIAGVDISSTARGQPEKLLTNFNGTDVYTVKTIPADRSIVFTTQEYCGADIHY